MTSFIDIPVAKLAFPNCTFPGTDEQLQALIDSACQTIENHCWRKFESADYSEVLSSDGKNTLYVANPPISQIKAIYFMPTAALSIRNIDQNTQRANIQIQTDKLILTQISNGVSTSYPFAFGSGDGFYATLQELADVIIQYDGWEALVNSPFNGFASTELTPWAGMSQDAKVQSYLRVFARELPRYDAHLEEGEIFLPYLTPVAYRQYRIVYTGGFNPVPEPICKAASELCRIAYDAQRVNGNLASESVNSGAYSYSRDGMRGLLDSLSGESRAALAAYSLARPVYYKEGRV